MNLRRLFRCAGGAYSPTPSPSPSPTPTPTPTPGTLPSVDTSRLSTSAATQRTSILNVIAGERWNGWTGQSFATDVAVNSVSALHDAIFAALDSNPNAWNRIRIQSGGDWTGDLWDKRNVSFGDRPVFGTNGGVYITTDTGHDQEITGVWTMVMKHAHFYGLRFCRAANTGVAGVDNQIQLGLDASYPDTTVIFENCRFGAYYNSTKTASDYATFSRAIWGEFVRQLRVINCTFRWTNRSIWLFNYYVYEAYGNDFNECVQNGHSMGVNVNDSTWASWKGKFPSDNCYGWVRQNLHRGCFDNADTLGSVHNDFWQNLDQSGYQNGHTPAGPLPIPPGAQMTVMEGNWLISGYTKMDGSGLISSINGYVPTDGLSPHTCVFFNNVQLCAGFPVQDYGTHGTMFVECNTSGPGPQLPVGYTYNPSSNAINTQDAAVMSSAKNIVRALLASDTSVINDSGTVLMDDRTSAIAPARPGDRMAGPFVTADSRYLVDIANYRTLTRDVLVASIVAHTVPTGAAGATFI